jgi:hypothetical protein
MSHTIIALLCGLGVSVAIGLGVSLFAKFFPKEETFRTKIAPVVEKIAVGFFMLLGRWLKISDIEKVDEGILKTLGYWLVNSSNVFFDKLDSLIKNAENKK